MGFLDSVSSVLSLAPAAAQIYGSYKQNKWNKEAAQKQMDFQSGMSNTSYQRGVEDLKAAGLNPMLAYMSGGSSTPTGASYHAENPFEGISSSALQVKQNIEQMKEVRQAVKESKAREKLNESQKHLADVNARAGDALADVHESEAFTAKNRVEFERMNPKVFGAVDAIMRRLGVVGNSALSLFGAAKLGGTLFGKDKGRLRESGSREIQLK